VFGGREEEEAVCYIVVVVNKDVLMRSHLGCYYVS
jgi:hypothetical protein